MKYTLAVAALLGNASALKAYTTAAVGYEATYAAGSEATGKIDIGCSVTMRQQKTDAAAWHFYSKYLFKTSPTTVTMLSKKSTEVACKGILTASKCTTATDTAAGTASLKANFGYITGVKALNGNRVNGAFACGQELDSCPGTKFRTITAGTETKVTLKVNQYEAGCSYLFTVDCSAPYIAVDTGNASHAAANYAALTMAVVEYDNKLAAAEYYTSAVVTARKFIPASAVDSFTMPTAADIQTLPKDEYAFTDNATDGKDQSTKLGAKVKWYIAKGSASSTGVDADFLALNLLWAAKKAEYAQYATDKAAYETKKTAYNTALDAAEKLVKDTLDKDIFRKLTPTEADKKILNAVPERPNYPTVPATYNGPAVGTATTYEANTIWAAPAALETNSDNYLWLAPGKAFGTRGAGSVTSTAITAAADQKDTAIALGVVFQEKPGGTTCVKNSMMFQVGYAAADSTLLAAATNTQHIKAGAKTAAKSFDSLGTAPVAATAPKIPSTGASMLAAGAATVAVAMTLF